MTVKGGTTPACAACKYQRRKCSPTCPLAPYFPANQTQMFRSVHRLFGVSNVTKTLEKLKSKDLREDAMRSIIYEAEMREKFPVHGCCAVIGQLYDQLKYAHDELNNICTHLEVYRDLSNKAVVDWTDSSGDVVPQLRYQYYENGDEESAVKPLLLTIESDTMSNNLSMIEAQMEGFGIHENTNDYISSGIFDDRHCYTETKIEDKIEDVRDGFELR